MTVEVIKRSARLITLHYICQLEVTETTDATDIASAWRRASTETSFLTSDMAQLMMRADMGLLNPSGEEQHIDGKDFSNSADHRMEAVQGSLLFHFYCDVVSDEDLTPELLNVGLKFLGESAKIK